jgi:hypothetical protein
MAREIIRKTPQFTIRITDVVLADCPSDGGKWALMCEHLDIVSGEWFNGGIIQDTNKKRLAGHRSEVRGAGFCDWCPECQAAHDEEIARA